MTVKLQDISDAFAAMRLANKHDPKTWKKKISKQLTSNDGINEFEQLAKIKAIVSNFIEENDIYTEENVYQSDLVIENAYDFIVDLAKISGYKKRDY